MSKKTKIEQVTLDAYVRKEFDRETGERMVDYVAFALNPRVKWFKAGKMVTITVQPYKVRK